jgi:dolichol-phosphate mannosyltransferase
MRVLIAIPVYNEEKRLADVLRRSLEHGLDVLVVDDGSTDQTPRILRAFPAVRVIRRRPNRGYGAALRSAFDHACNSGYDAVITLDADGQHSPGLIPAFLDRVGDCDIVSGSRYLRRFETDTPAPAERRRINLLVTDQLNACFHLGITDSFCGYKAYRTDALARMTLTEDGYGMPLELWVQAACLGLTICEIAVPRLYLDPERTFGALENADARLAYYQRVIDAAMARAMADHGCRMPTGRVPILQPCDS